MAVQNSTDLITYYTCNKTLNNLYQINDGKCSPLITARTKPRVKQQLESGRGLRNEGFIGKKECTQTVGYKAIGNPRDGCSRKRQYVLSLWHLAKIAYKL